jgi:hypothetical protein
VKGRDKVNSYRDLLVWGKGIELTKELYAITKNSLTRNDSVLLLKLEGPVYLFLLILLKVRRDRAQKNL